MTYYKVTKPDIYDYRTGYTTIKDELLTERERREYYPLISDKCFEKVELNKNKTYIGFGARFECSTED